MHSATVNPDHASGKCQQYKNTQKHWPTGTYFGRANDELLVIINNYHRMGIIVDAASAG
jgi:hypothetical protein